MRRDMEEKIKFNPDKKFDIQLSASLIAERKLGDLFTSAKLERVDLSPECWKIEQKTESWLWERTGNLCIEYRNRGKLSGIASTEADFWIHELKRDDDTLIYIVIPVPHLRDLCKKYIKEGRARDNAGDDGQSSVVLVPIRDILK
jgi:hypothetical protein